mgnify:CR=1 FL=1
MLETLLAIAEDARGNPAECAAAAGQAERIMRKYQLDNADVLLRGMQSGAEFGELRTGSGLDPFDPDARFSPAAGRIAVAVAKLHDCQVRLTAGNAKLEFCGLRIDAILARFTYLMLVNTMTAVADLWKKKNGASASARAEYIEGYATAVVESLRKAREEREAESRMPGAFGALVVAKAALVRSHYGDPRYAAGHSRSFGAAASSAASPAATAFVLAVQFTQHGDLDGARGREDVVGVGHAFAIQAQPQASAHGRDVTVAPLGHLVGAEHVLRLAHQPAVAVDGIDPPAQLRQDGGLIAGAGTDLEHAADRITAEVNRLDRKSTRLNSSH